MSNKGKYITSISRVYGYCRWNHKYPPDDWCIFGLSIWWASTERYFYRIGAFGFEIRIEIKREWIKNGSKESL